MNAKNMVKWGYNIDHKLFKNDRRIEKNLCCRT